jgi:serralysin
MATLTLTGSGSQDHTTDALNGIDAIEFNTSGALTVFFDAAQFDDAQISTSVSLTFDNNADFFEVTNAANFSAAAWTVTNFDAAIHLIVIFGTTGNDNITGSSQTDFLLGGSGDDVIDGGGGFNFAGYFFDGAVTVSLAIAGPQNTGSAGTDTLTNIQGLEGSNTGGDTLTGDDFANVFLGWGGNDVLVGGAGNDVLVGGLGRDKLTGGADSDRFDFDSILESRAGANHDKITDFKHGTSVTGDHIDLSDIDANTKAVGDQDFKFIGSQAFHHQRGELHTVRAGANLLVQGDVNGDGKADFEILLSGIHHLVKADFIL